MKQRLLTFVLILVLLNGYVISWQNTAASADTTGWQQGVNLQSKSTTDFGSDTTKQSLQDLKTIGASMATFVVSIYQTNTTSCDIAAGFNTPTDAALTTGIQNAKALGLQAAIVIHLETSNNVWRANIQPTQRNCWFSAYNGQLMHYAQLAQTTGVAQFSLGAELNGVTNPTINPNNTTRWQKMITTVRSLYKGTLTYDAQRGSAGKSEATSIEFWPNLDLIQLSAYYPIKVSGTLTVTNIKAAWAPIEQNYIRPMYAKYQKPIAFGEVGYRSLTLARQDPYSYTRQGAVDLQEQKALYQGFFNFWKNISYFQGVQLWEWETDPTAGGNTTSSYTVQNKPAANVIAFWYGGTAPTHPATAMKVDWPTPGATISGTCQVFKAYMTDRDINASTIQWRVDGDRLNPMYISNVDNPHWEAQVDVSTWNWKSTGPYTIDFVDTNSSTGQVDSTTSVSVYVAPSSTCDSTLQASRPADMY